MQSLPDDKLLKFHPDALLTVRKSYNLDKPGQMDEAIDLLENWVKKQSHLIKKDYSREYLERAIILHKGSIERAKAFIDNLCTYKTVLPHLFDKYDAKDLEHVKKNYSSALLPKLTKDYYRVYYGKFWNNDVTAKMLLDSYKYCGLMSEYLSAKDYNLGYVAVIDYRDLNLPNLISAFNFTDLSRAINVLMKGFSYRLKEIQLITSSKAVDILVKILKKCFSEKMSNRIFVHFDTDSLQKFLPKDILLLELDGHEKSLKILHDEWNKELSQKENIEYMKEMMTEALVDKSYKQVNEMSTELEGSFRSLSVD